MDDAVKTKNKIEYYLKLVLKKRWFIILPLIMTLSVGICLSIMLPRVYKARTLILVIPKSVPDKYVPNLLSTDVQQRINTIKQQMLSRSNLEKIIDELHLFSGPEYENMYLIDKIENIRKRVQVRVSKSRGGIESFTIEFTGKDPQKVAKVVNTLAETFINESIKVIESEVIETNKFLAGQLAHLRRKLEETETAINQYRKKHMGELPEELSSNLATLTRLQLELSEKQQNIRDAKNRLIVLENNIATEKASIQALARRSSGVIREDVPEDEPLTELEKQRKLLEILKTKYTSRHPDIIRLKNSIAALEAKQKEDMRIIKPKSKNKDKSAKDMPYENLPPKYNRALMTLLAQADAIKREIEIYKEDVKRIEDKISMYQKRVENTPKREQDLIALKRNYTNVQRSYANFLDRKLESDIAVDMERKQKGQKFRVVDKARVPKKPISPKVPLMFAVSIILGAGLGGGLIFIMDFFDNSLKDPEKIEKKLGVPVLATIPEIVTKKDIISHRLNHILTIISLLIIMGLLGIFAILSAMSVERVIALVHKFI